jgi:hypothetical protein
MVDVRLSYRRARSKNLCADASYREGVCQALFLILSDAVGCTAQSHPAAGVCQLSVFCEALVAESTIAKMTAVSNLESLIVSLPNIPDKQVVISELDGDLLLSPTSVIFLTRFLR